MRDPMSWSIPVGRMFGISVRVHILFPVVALGLILRAGSKGTYPGTWVDAAWLMGLLFFTVFWHELGHCYVARRVGGDASEVLLWPLGGLAYVEVPHNPRANFLVAFGGPAVNLIICFICALILGFAFEKSWQPLWNPLTWPFREDASGSITLYLWNGKDQLTNDTLLLIVSRLFFVSWFTFLLNLLPGFPLDGGRMLQAILWHFSDYRQAMQNAIIAGYITMLVLVIYSFWQEEVMMLALAVFIYLSCTQEYMRLEQAGEDSLFGYDFSQGYTSLERDQDGEEVEPPPPEPKKPGFWQRWLQRRAERKRQAELEEKQAEESRMDQLLEKIQRQGKESLTEEENRFLKRVAERYKHRQ
jgi:stage IV sporulation protein FB